MGLIFGCLANLVLMASLTWTEILDPSLVSALRSIGLIQITTVICHAQHTLGQIHSSYPLLMGLSLGHSSHSPSVKHTVLPSSTQKEEEAPPFLTNRWCYHKGPWYLGLRSVGRSKYQRSLNQILDSNLSSPPSVVYIVISMCAFLYSCPRRVAWNDC